MSRELRALLLIAFIFAVGFVGYQVLFGDGLGDRFRIVTVAGEVEHVRANGEADQAVEGSVLREGDRIPVEFRAAVFIGDIRATMTGFHKS